MQTGSLGGAAEAMGHRGGGDQARDALRETYEVRSIESYSQSAFAENPIRIQTDMFSCSIYCEYFL